MKNSILNDDWTKQLLALCTLLHIWHNFCFFVTALKNRKAIKTNTIVKTTELSFASNIEPMDCDSRVPNFVHDGAGSQ